MDQHIGITRESALAWLAQAKRDYKVAYEEHQKANVSRFSVTLEGWRSAWKELNAAEAVCDRLFSS